MFPYNVNDIEKLRSTDLREVCGCVFLSSPHNIPASADLHYNSNTSVCISLSSRAEKT